MLPAYPATHHSATLHRFPARNAAVVWLTPERDGGWLVLTGSHGWHHGSSAAASADARWLAENFGGLPIRELTC